MQVIKRPSNNFVPGRQGHKPEAIIIQMLNSNVPEAVAKANQPDSKFSLHYIIGKQGEVLQLVEEENMAWHSPGPAQSNWRLLKPNINPNLYTLGIGIEGKNGESLSEEMYQACGWLISKLSANWEILIDEDHIIGVEQINRLGKKDNPGIATDFQKIMDLAVKDVKKNAIVPMSEDSISPQAAKIIANLELRCAALEETLQKSQTDQDSIQELKDLLQQNTRMSEEVYMLQQEKTKLKKEIESLVSFIDTEKRTISLEAYSSRKLLQVLVNKVLTPFRS